MGAASDLRLTNTDLEAMPEDGNRYEVIDGELYVSGAPSVLHQTIVTNMVGAFLGYLREHPIGRVVPGVGVIFDDYNGVIPDLVFATHDRMNKALVGGRFRAAPEIVIEILSPGVSWEHAQVIAAKRGWTGVPGPHGAASGGSCASNERPDRHVKRSLYGARGAGEYWIVDPENRSVEIHRRNEAGDLVSEKSLRPGDELTSGLLPGFGVPVDALFA